MACQLLSACCTSNESQKINSDDTCRSPWDLMCVVTDNGSFAKYLQHCIRAQSSVPSLYGKFRVQGLPYKEGTELWGLIVLQGFCKILYMCCGVNGMELSNVEWNYGVRYGTGIMEWEFMVNLTVCIPYMRTHSSYTTNTYFKHLHMPWGNIYHWSTASMQWDESGILTWVWEAVENIRGPQGRMEHVQGCWRQQRVCKSREHQRAPRQDGACTGVLKAAESLQEEGASEGPKAGSRIGRSVEDSREPARTGSRWEYQRLRVLRGESEEQRACFRYEGAHSFPDLISFGVVTRMQ